MLRKLGFLFAALALFSIAGGQWAVLQTVAWAGMLHDYTQRTGSITVAIEQTFDGEHPCELCRDIATAKDKEQKEKPAIPGAKDDAKVKAMVADGASPSLITPAAIPARVLVASVFPFARTEPPPTPPPRRGTLAA